MRRFLGVAGACLGLESCSSCNKFCMVARWFRPVRDTVERIISVFEPDVCGADVAKTAADIGQRDSPLKLAPGNWNQVSVGGEVVGSEQRFKGVCVSISRGWFGGLSFEYERGVSAAGLGTGRSGFGEGSAATLRKARLINKLIRPRRTGNNAKTVTSVDRRNLRVRLRESLSGSLSRLRSAPG